MHKDCFFTAASILMELVLTESRIAPVNDSFFGLPQSFGEKTGWSWGKWFSAECDQALGDRKFHILNKRCFTVLDPMVLFTS